MMGQSKIEIPHDVISSIKRWNQQKNTTDYDKHVTDAILLVCVPARDLARFSVKEDVKNLIVGKFKK